MPTPKNIAPNILWATVIVLALVVIWLMRPLDAGAKQSNPTHDEKLARECTSVPARDHLSVHMPFRVCLGFARSRMPERWVVSRSLHEIVWRESSNDPCAVNPSRHDCNYTGSNACGLFQFSACRCLHRGAVRPQANCGYTYIKSRYGNPKAALAYHDAHGSY